MAAWISAGLNASVPRATNKVCNLSLGEDYPLCLQHGQKMLLIAWRWIVVSNPVTQKVSDMLSLVQIRTVGWPVRADNLSLLLDGQSMWVT